MLRLACQLLLTLMLTAAFSADADMVFLKNGDRISGAVAIDDAGQVTVTTDYGGTLTIPAERVARYETAEAVLEASNTQVEKALALTAEPPSRNWDANVTLSSMLSRGNTDSKTINMQSGYKLKRGDHRYLVDITSVREEEDGNTSKEQDELDLGYQYLFRPQWFFATNVLYERDPIADLDRRVSVNPAVGYVVWEEDDRSLDFQLGAGYADEKVGNGSESTSFVEWRLTYEQDVLADSMEVFHRHKIYRDLGGRRNTAFKSETGFRYDISEDIYLNVQVNYDYDTEPAAEAESDDLTVLIGAGVDF